MHEIAAWPADHVERWAIERLIPYSRNPRTHSEEQVAQLCGSMKEWGWTIPVLVDEGGVLIAGHGRLLAAQRLGWQEVPVMIACGWSEAKKRAYVIADNKLALNAGWDAELLGVELLDLRDGGADLSLTGFALSEISELLRETPEGALPQLPEGDRPPFQQITFTLHDSQAALVQAALKEAHARGPYEDSPNENSNGNALARICETYLGNG